MANTNIKIVVLDDQRELAKKTATLLEREGCEVLIPEHAEISKTIFDHAGTIDVVMSDWSFDDYDFADLTRSLRQKHNVRLDKIPCIISTGVNNEVHCNIHQRLAEINIVPLAIIEKPAPTRTVFNYLPF